MSNDAIQIDPRDNVATALNDLRAGQTVRIAGGRGDWSITLVEPVRAGHKIALRNIQKDETIIKYGEIIGVAVQAIAAGSHVHIHNVEGRRGRGDLK